MANAPVWSGWRRIIAGLSILIVLILLIFSSLRMAEVLALTPPASGGDAYGPPAEFHTRYLDFPVLSALHVLTGIVFVTLGLFQFKASIRTRYPAVHRWMGRGLVISALVSAVTGIWLGYVLPGFGGIAGLFPTWVLGIVLVVSVCFAVSHIRKRRVAKHREWMIRAFAAGLAVGTQRLLLGIFMPMQIDSFEALFVPLLWLGIFLNLVIAEWWINVTRR